ncbi:MAG: hypothetical protein H5T41_02425 [Methanomassiliicoccales archaeon]|nr:hypothetical protein [Methanomassiliicoccales archaeon]
MTNQASGRLIWFYGRECPHCRAVRSLVNLLKEELGVEIVELEVWHNEENAQLMRRYSEVISKACGGDLGVPAFYNEKTGKALCGKVTIEKLRNWASE